MRAFIILSLLVAASNADVSHLVGHGHVGSASVLRPTLVSGGGLVRSSGLIGGSIVRGGGLIGGSRLVGNTVLRPATTIVSNGGLIGGGSTLINSGGIIGGGLVGGQVIGGGLVGGSNIVSSNLVGGQIVGGGLVSGGNIVGSGAGIRPGSTTVVGIDAVDSIPPSVEYSKQVFYFSAPEEEQQTGVIQQQLSNVLKKNLQVVFIKAPENAAATNAALQLAKQAIEQRTAIYVLSKENDANTIVGQLQQIQENVPTVPEVRIVKYRTPEDLAYATQIIKDQYNDIGGPSGIINGGEAPVLNYSSGQGSVGTVNVIGASGLVGGGSVNVVGGSGLVSGVSNVVGNVVSNNVVDASGLSGLQVIGGLNRVVSGVKSSSGGYLPPNLKK